MHITHIEAVVKVTERCNINCDYCYVYNKGNEDFKFRPALMKNAEFAEITRFLFEGAKDLSATKLSVVFHGGEPLLLKKHVFAAFCQSLRDGAPDGLEVNIGVQTNALLLDDQWIDLFHKHKVMVSVSIDGPADVHDAHRKDHKNRGTHAGVVKGLALLMEAAAAESVPKPGVICVIDPRSDAKRIYRYFVDDLGISALSFHLPMDTYETGDWIDQPALDRYLVELFDEWVNDDNPSIHIRMFEEVMAHFLRSPDMLQSKEVPQQRLQHVTISTDGTIGVDELKPSGIKHDAYDVRTSTLAEYADSDLSGFLKTMYTTVPTACSSCIWTSYCVGGSKHGVVVNRWSNTMGFNNRSLICGPLTSLYSRVAAYLISTGVDPDVIAANIAMEHFPLTFAGSGAMLPKEHLYAVVTA